MNSPERRANNEYHSLVSPIVRNGGLSRDNHRPAIKIVSMRVPSEARHTAVVLLSLAKNAEKEAAADNTIAEIPNHMKASQVISIIDFVFYQGLSEIKEMHLKASSEFLSVLHISMDPSQSEECNNWNQDQPRCHIPTDISVL